jgi:hypothetical protein
MDDIEIIRCEIQSEIYERQIKVLIEQLTGREFLYQLQC